MLDEFDKDDTTFQQKLVNVPKQTKHLKFVIAAIIGTEFCERLCYYGIQGSLNLFCQNELNQSKADAAFNVAMFGGVCYLTPLLGGFVADSYLGRFKAILFFLIFYIIGIVGIAIIAMILAQDNHNEAQTTETIFFWISLYLVALGTGGIKPNVSTLGAEQFECDDQEMSNNQSHEYEIEEQLSLFLADNSENNQNRKTRTKHNKSESSHEQQSELMPVAFNTTTDNDITLLQSTADYAVPKDVDDTHANALRMTDISNVDEEFLTDLTLQKQRKQKESFFNWFYFSINLGSFFSFSIIAYICQNISFGIGYSIPAGMLIIGTLIFFFSSKYYRIVAAQGSVLWITLQIIFYGLCQCKSTNNAKRRFSINDSQYIDKHWLNKCKETHGGPFVDYDVESVKCVMNVMPFLALQVLYWCVYQQQSTLFYAQGCQMDLTVFDGFEVPIATLGLFDVVAILILVPCFDRLLIPYLRKKGFKVTMLQRMTFGFVFAVLAMVAAALVELIRKDATISNSMKSACNSGDNTIYVSNMSIFWQVPQFALTGVSEVLASITGIEFFFSQAPPNMRSTLSALNLVTVGMGSWLVGIFILLVNINKNDEWITDNLNNGHLDYYFFMLAFMTLLTTVIFIFFAKRYQYKSFDMDAIIIDNESKRFQSDMIDDIDGIMISTPKTPPDANFDSAAFDYASHLHSSQN